MKRAAARRLSRVVAGQDSPGASGVLRGGAVVTVVNKTPTPWVVDVLMPDGSTVTGVPCVGWYNPRVNDVVMIGMAGNSLVCLGGFAGAAQVVATTATLSTPTTGAVPEPVVAVPTVVTKYVSPNAGRTWAPQLGGWRSDTDLKQGGPAAQRAFWFYGTKIATAKGAGKITGATIYVRRLGAGGVYGNANVRLGSHNQASQGASGATGHSNVTKVGTLGLSQAKTFRVPSTIIAQWNAGTMSGIGLEPGAIGTESPDYLAAQPVGSSYPSGQLALTIET